MLVFRKILRMYLMDDPVVDFQHKSSWFLFVQMAALQDRCYKRTTAFHLDIKWIFYQSLQFEVFGFFFYFIFFMFLYYANIFYLRYMIFGICCVSFSTSLCKCKYRFIRCSDMHKIFYKKELSFIINFYWSKFFALIWFSGFYYFCLVCTIFAFSLGVCAAECAMLQSSNLDNL